MQLVKNTQRAQVARNFSGSFVKFYSGPNKLQRFENEVRVLQYLNERGCEFVPKLLAHDSDQLCITTSYAGEPVQRISLQRLSELFDELSEFGVRHDDPAQRNVLYSHSLGRFTIIDFEFAEILEHVDSSDFSNIDQRFDRLEAAIGLAQS